MKREKLRLRPTALWIVFGPVLVCIWLAAVNYSNNLVYAVLYLIASLCFISLFHTWRNLAALRVDSIRVKSAFAGEDVTVEIFLSSPAKYPIYGLVFARLGEGAEQPQLLLRRGGGAGRIKPGDTCSCETAFPSLRRGQYRFESLLVKSSYPFGLFWAAFAVPVGAFYFVYPQPKGTEGWPEMRPAGEDGSPYSLKPGDDFSGVRAYSPGESLRHVDWKAYARGRPLSVKQFTGGDGLELWLDAGHLERLPLEERLSQLALWVVNAEKAEIPYALKLGRTAIPIGLGPAQARRALEALAVAGIDPAARLY